MSGAIGSLLIPWFAALKPRERLRPSEFAEQALILPPSNNARPGRLELSKAQRGMIDAAIEPGVREIVMMTATQCGKTISLNSLLMWSAAGEAGPMLLVRPTDADARSFIRENLDPLIEASPRLRALIGNGTKGLDSIGFKTFPGGSLAVASSYNAAGLAGRSIRVLVADEVDRFAPNVQGEGEPVSIAKRRTATFDHSSLTILASSPTLKATSRIAEHHARGDQRVFKVKCLSCGDADDLTPDRLKFEPGRPQTARLLCLCCGHRATEHDRISMLSTGEWVPTANGEPGVVSFHMGELASEFSTLARVATAVDKAVKLEDRKVLTNTVYGLPYESDAEAEVDPNDLYSRAIEISEPYDSAIDFITAGVDVQSNRVEITLLASTVAEAIVLDHVTLFGDSSGNRVWGDLDEFLSRIYRVKDGRTLSVASCFIDSGFAQQSVVEFVASQRAKGRKTWPIKGVPGFDRPAMVLGKKIRSLVRAYAVGVDGIKLAVLKGLAASDPGVRPIRLPNHLDPEYFVQLTAERLEVRYIRGYPRHNWVKNRHTRNEAIDCLTYATAAALTVQGRAVSGDAEKTPSYADRWIAINRSSKNKESEHAR